MMVAGIVFSNIHDSNLPELTKNRTCASIPFGCRYRLIDFALSNFVNSNIFNIMVIAHYNYQSLMEHLGSGKDWDLARRSGGIRILPPYITAHANYANTLYSSRLEALKSVSYVLRDLTADYIVMTDCDVVCNIDFTDIIRHHISTGADMTTAVKTVELTEELAQKNTVYMADPDGNVIDIFENPQRYSGQADIGLNISVINRKFLEMIVMDSIAHGYTSMVKDIILKNIGKYKFGVYRYDGYCACISSFEDYFKYSMRLLDKDGEFRNALFKEKNRPVYTRVRNSIPTRYKTGSVVTDSLIADGCVIEGTVENSILFRDVKVSKNATVRNCILMRGTYIGENSYLNCVVSDRDATVRDGRLLSGVPEQPYYISKSQTI